MKEKFDFEIECEDVENSSDGNDLKWVCPICGHRQEELECGLGDFFVTPDIVRIHVECDGCGQSFKLEAIGETTWEAYTFRFRKTNDKRMFNIKDCLKDKVMIGDKK